MADHAYDLVLRGGTVLDGSGAPGFVADVGVRRGLIAAVGPGLTAGREEIDARGRLVTPALSTSTPTMTARRPGTRA